MSGFWLLKVITETQHRPTDIETIEKVPARVVVIKVPFQMAITCDQTHVGEFILKPPKVCQVKSVSPVPTSK